MCRRVWLSLPFAVFASSAIAFGQVREPATLRPARDSAGIDSARTWSRGVRFDLPLLDVPYNTKFGARAPSMQQSLEITAGVYDIAHRAIVRPFGSHTKIAKVTITAFDIFGTTLPFADAWLHEEWHRAILGNRGVDSRNDVYLLKLLAPTISVSHVSDEALTAFKAQHPAEFVRIKEAGIEGEYALITRLEKERFYNGAHSWNTALYWLTTLGAVIYVGDTTGTDKATDDMNAEEPTVAGRDISGHDFTAWVRDLFRPTEPYAAHGLHPTGVGINRYTKTTDLTLEERAYLHKEGRLGLLNFVDPNLLGLHGFNVWSPANGAPLRMNFALRHQLTSFGHAIDANVFLKRGATNLFVVLHTYDNDAHHALPGVDAELLDVPITLKGHALDVSPRIAAWIQPAGQAFRVTNTQAGGLAALRIGAPLSKRIGALFEVEAKTAGWVAGVAQLDKAVNARVGVSTVP
ncbi:MAG: hypothetical protein ABJB66_01105 [Gemmatimonadaceae bacterium]